MGGGNGKGFLPCCIVLGRGNEPGAQSCAGEVVSFCSFPGNFTLEMK